MASTPRMLIVGWDGAAWPDIHPLLDRLPALERLVENGAGGALAGLSPPIPQVAWTTLATGLRANRHGVTAALEVRPDGGGVEPIGRRSWQAPAFWEWLTAAGAGTVVIAWPATSPASRWPGVVIDDGFARFRNEPPQDWPMPRHAVSPAALRATIADLRIHPAEIDADQLRHFLPDVAPGDSRAPAIATALAETASIQAAVTCVMAEQSWDLCAVRFPLLERLAAVAPKHSVYRFLDMMLGRLVGLAGDGARIVVVSPNGPLAAGAPPTDGVLVAAGPGIRSDTIVHGATVLDVCPTVLAMFGTTAPGDGRVLSEIFTAPPQLTLAPPVDRDGQPSPQPATGLDPAAARLVADATFTSRMVLGEAALADGDAGAAARWFEAALQQRPDDVAILLRLAFCCIRLSDAERLRRVSDRLASGDSPSAWSELVIGAAKALNGIAGADKHFTRAAQLGSQDAMVHLWLGEVAMRLEQPAAAEAHYRAALALAPHLAEAAANLGIACLARNDAAEAERFLRRALTLRYRWPAVHRRLAEALALQGRAQESAAALETAAQQESAPQRSSATP